MGKEAGFKAKQAGSLRERRLGKLTADLLVRREVPERQYPLALPSTLNLACFLHALIVPQAELEIIKFLG